MDDLSLKGIAPKLSQSWGIANVVTKPQELELSTGLEGLGHKEKRHKVLMCDSHTKSRKETPPKLRHKNPKKRL
jgi:hypothetical protein